MLQAHAPAASQQPICDCGIALLAACLALIQPDGGAAQETSDVVARDVLRPHPR